MHSGRFLLFVCDVERRAVFWPSAHLAGSVHSVSCVGRFRAVFNGDRLSVDCHYPGTVCALPVELVYDRQRTGDADIYCADHQAVYAASRRW